MDAYTWLQSNYAAVAEELESVRSLPPIPPDATEDAIVVLMNDVELPPDAQLEADFVPELLTFYLNNQLIFLKAQDEVLLNRLPV
ncbi:hypothetical protein H6F87_26355 [Cyanobacteria bacterium FACHB-502]|uniref:hypothetical protein n=1 Tax=Leptolyngbya sp. GB1-A1 TaxID=2933908 RepID=UPI0019C13CA2|nr:hypothetical protein [Cyanobacteria bacterium FACHB-502]